MQKIENHTIGIIGSGNVATKLAIALQESGNIITQIFSQRKEHSLRLAKLINVESIDSISDFNNNINIIIIAISDKALSKIETKYLPKNTLICHTSGSVNMDILNGCKNYGVFYPLQTFSIQSEVDISEVPFCLEANSKENLLLLQKLAESVSNNIYNINSHVRRKLHLAAVFACNFTNAMYSVAEDILENEDLDFNILRPLIKETAHKAITNSPKKIQTGPAVRQDMEIMNNHIAELSKTGQYDNIYKTISDLIYKLNKDKI